ncbi:Peptidyl-prolyl cis-trans isomerase ssp-1 [Penicillium diatomitis]|uniref:Peptidyl-prolyl cis-trans isomerase ssp-1 n=1 Tax=Penicillium diatomitis TaxID=2819901 RepID=A0A9X0BVB8_9EURO|nr:Peptidyl-prolyl cis-trans isomerase ssp-1 [Penicillium diatomitis]KAJ5485490.1 Peptidyl-prolyl cis-trans isomerase ssp-1 [Penicillium diatomitis]
MESTSWEDAMEPIEPLRMVPVVLNSTLSTEYRQAPFPVKDPSDNDTVFGYRGTPEDLRPPAYLRLPKDLRDKHERLIDAAWSVINGLRMLQNALDNHLVGLCPRGISLVLENHVHALELLDEKKGKTSPEPEDGTWPSSSPAAKIPSLALQLRMNYRAYLQTTAIFERRMHTVLSVDWVQYRFIRLDVCLTAQRMAQHDFEAWSYWWRHEFMKHQNQWLPFLRRMRLPSWEQSVSDLYRLIRERADDPETVIANMMNTAEYLFHVPI